MTDNKSVEEKRRMDSKERLKNAGIAVTEHDAERIHQELLDRGVSTNLDEDEQEVWVNVPTPNTRMKVQHISPMFHACDASKEVGVFIETNGSTEEEHYFETSGEAADFVRGRVFR